MNPTPPTSDVWSILKAPQPPAGQAWLHWHPTQLEECLAARAGHLPEPLRGDELAELRQAHQRWGADAAALDNLAALGETRARVVVTGQQPDLLAGPLLVAYKTIGAIKLARQLQAAHPALRFVPVFWVAAEDHDFDEIRRVFWPGHSGQLEEFLLNQSCWKTGRMVGRIHVGEQLEKLIGQVSETTFRTEFRGEVLEHLRQAYAGDADLETGFARLMLRLFAGTGLVVVSPLQTWVRRRAAAIFQQELARPGESTRLVLERADAMLAAGLEPTLHRAPQAVNAFWVDGEDRRYTLRLDRGAIQRTLAGTGSRAGAGAPLEEARIDPPPLEPAALRLMLATNPLQFSGNVVTRPMIQDSVLPTVAQLIGPGEASYLAQVEAVYRDFGVFAPLRYPRPQVTLVEPRVTRHLAKYRLELREALELNAAELMARVVRQDMEQGELKSLQEMRARQLQELAALQTELAKPGSGVEGAFRRLAQAMEKGFDTISERLLYQRQEDERHVAQALVLLTSSLRPAGVPQERRLNPLIPFALNYGPDWLAALSERIRIDPREGMQTIDLAGVFRETASPPTAD